MSVLVFGEEEIANVILAALGDNPNDQHEGQIGIILDYAERLAAFSEANVMCFDYSYIHRDDVDPDDPWFATAHSITRAVVAKCRNRSSIDYSKAQISVGLMHYNLIANDGSDFSSREIMETLFNLLYSIGDKIQMKERYFSSVYPHTAKAPAVWFDDEALFYTLSTKQLKMIGFTEAEIKRLAT